MCACGVRTEVAVGERPGGAAGPVNAQEGAGTINAVADTAQANVAHPGTSTNYAVMGGVAAAACAVGILVGIAFQRRRLVSAASNAMGSHSGAAAGGGPISREMQSNVFGVGASGTEAAGTVGAAGSGAEGAVKVSDTACVV
jgi:hypothetical protein